MDEVAVLVEARTGRVLTYATARSWEGAEKRIVKWFRARAGLHPADLTEPHLEAAGWVIYRLATLIEERCLAMVEPLPE